MKRFPAIVGLILAVVAPFISDGWATEAMPPATAAPVTAHFLAATTLDVARILPAPPTGDSLAAQGDLETVLQLQAARTPAQETWVKFTEQDDLFKNASVLGTWFTAADLPLTAEFFGQVDDDGYAIWIRANALYPRLRPSQADARVHPCIALPKSTSYPSGHSSQAWMWAELLAEIFPEKRTELLERARAVAWARVTAGVHYPTDDIGGKQLADAIVAELLKNLAVQAAIKKCRDEAAPFLHQKAA